jgi:hypothetical protein
MLFNLNTRATGRHGASTISHQSSAGVRDMDREAGYNLGAISAGGISVHRTAIVQIDDGSKTYYAGVRVLSSGLLCGEYAERRDFIGGT